MTFKQTKQALEAFANTVIKQSKGNLRRHRNNKFITGSTSGELENSLDYKLTVGADGFNVQFFMADYGTFQDLGVKGSKSTYPKSKDSPYKYSGRFKSIPPQTLDKWMVKKSIKGIRDEEGRFIGRKSLRFLLAKSIYEKGLRASFFFTKPFENAFIKIPDELIEKFALDIDEFIGLKND
jgi:hypothetical protein|tara:strand:+ start:1070 stop:1609 length:540 start_codon:yes stop_codon:yes gene_type:complete